MVVHDQPHEIFNFRKRFYQKVTHSKILVSKTIVSTLKTFKYAMIKILIFKPTIIKSKTTFNSELSKNLNSQTLTKNKQNTQTTGPFL